MAQITINNISFDPEMHRPALAAARMLRTDSTDSNYILVQMRGPLTAEQQEQLAAAGAEVLEYVPEDTYLCRYRPSDLGPIRALPFVAWANVYMKELKVKAGLYARRPGATAALMTLGPLDHIEGTDPVTVDVVLQQGEDPEGLRNEIATAAAVDPASIDLGTRKLRLTTQRRHLPAVAAIDAVRHVEEFVPPKLANNVGRQILAVDPPLPPSPLPASNQIIAVCDTGLDTGVISTIHPAFTGRVNKLYALGRTTTSSDPNGHGTHVAGSALGDGTSTTLGKIQGTAPAAKLVFQSVLDSRGGLTGIPTDLTDLFDPPYTDDNARVHTNSWGSKVNGDYTTQSTELDTFVWDNRDLVICVAAGNEGSDALGTGKIAQGSLTAPGSAKNCITVGASENTRPSYAYGGVQPAQTYGDLWSTDYPVEPMKSAAIARKPAGIVPFSSRGPAKTNRFKPDVVAPGTAIISAKSTLAPVPTPSDWGATSDPLYMYEGGTSMATPLVAGCAAVVRQWLSGKLVNPPAGKPTAALVKAVLINTAVPLSGQFSPAECGTPPDNSQGYGRVNLAPLWGGDIYQPVVQDEDVALITGQQSTVTTVALPTLAGGVTLTATLVWTDLAGDSLQNDLDLTVEALDASGNVIPSAPVWHGNKPSGSTDFDRANNVEQVTWPNFPGATARLTITAHRTVQAQNFAVVYRVSTVTLPMVARVSFVDTSNARFDLYALPAPGQTFAPKGSSDPVPLSRFQTFSQADVNGDGVDEIVQIDWMGKKLTVFGQQSPYKMKSLQTGNFSIGNVSFLRGPGERFKTALSGGRIGEYIVFRADPESTGANYSEIFYVFGETSLGQYGLVEKVSIPVPANYMPVQFGVPWAIGKYSSNLNQIAVWWVAQASLDNGNQAYRPTAIGVIDNSGGHFALVGNALLSNNGTMMNSARPTANYAVAASLEGTGRQNFVLIYYDTKGSNQWVAKMAIYSWSSADNGMRLMTTVELADAYVPLDRGVGTTSSVTDGEGTVRFFAMTSGNATQQIIAIEQSSHDGSTFGPAGQVNVRVFGAGVSGFGQLSNTQAILNSLTSPNGGLFSFFPIPGDNAGSIIEFADRAGYGCKAQIYQFTAAGAIVSLTPSVMDLGRPEIVSSEMHVMTVQPK